LDESILKEAEVFKNTVQNQCLFPILLQIFLESETTKL